MNDENISPINRKTAAVTDCHKRWMEISRDALAPKISEFPTRVAELTKLFEPRRVPVTDTRQAEIFGQDIGVNTEISGNFKLHVAEVQSYLTEIANLRRTSAGQLREISDLRQELRILGEVHADEKENFQLEMAATLRACKTEIRKLEAENSECMADRAQLKDDLSRRLRQLATAAEKYNKLKIGNSKLLNCDFQWQQKFFDMQSELELQRENFRQQITDLYWETVREYEAAFSAELGKQEEIFAAEKCDIKKSNQDQLWHILLWSQALTVFLAFVFYFLAIR